MWSYREKLELVSNLTTKSTQTSIELAMENLTVLKFGKLELPENLHSVSNLKKSIFQIRIFEEISLFLFVKKM